MVVEPFENFEQFGLLIFKSEVRKIGSKPDYYST